MPTAKNQDKDPQVLRELYWDEGLTLQEIADQYGVAESTIWNCFERYNIDRREQGAVGDNSGPRANKIGYYNDISGYCIWSGSVDIDGFSTTSVHQLLAVAGGADPYKVYSGGDYQIHHKNGVKWDNRPENIEVVTPKEHAERHPEKYEELGGEKYTDEEMIEWIQMFVSEFGYVPTSEDIEGWPGPSQATYHNRFGSWTKAVKAAGWDIPDHPTDSKGRRVGYEEPKPVGGVDT